jgi:uncharacterized protein YndB with AHSA1/START domain
MTDQTPAAPIRKRVRVPLDPDAAFRLFTEGIDRWWPKKSHSLSARDGVGDKARVRVEPREGGRVIETRADGSEAPWATVITWEPGRRFAMAWYVGRDEAEATVVDVRFRRTEGGTLVELEHSGFDVLGGKAGAVSASYDSGWDHVLDRLRRAAGTLVNV